MGNHTIQLQAVDQIRGLASPMKTMTVVVSDPCDIAFLKLSPFPAKPVQYELRSDAFKY